MYRSVLKHLIPGMTLWFLTGPAGCQLPAEDQERLTMREDNLAATAGLLTRGETGRLQRVEDTVAGLGRQEQRHTEEFARWGPKIEEAAGEEFNRFREQRSLYEREIQKKLLGKPENIPRTLREALY